MSRFGGNRFGAKKEDDFRPKPLNVNGLTVHAWNADASQVAISPNDHEVHIYATGGNLDDPQKWKRTHVLTGHSGFVSGIDWSPITNDIVTCGHDRNAYVWKYNASANEWSPTLVILRINRAATSVRWSPDSKKFAVTSGAKCVPVCHFEQGNNWWISKMIKKHKSTVTCLDWCPNNKFIVTGATDFKVRILSAFIEEIDPAEDDGFGAVFKKQHQFGEVLAEFDQAKAWINSVAWSPSGFRIAFAGHGSTMHFAQILAGAKPKVQTLYLKTLPQLSVAFLSDNVVVAGGFDCNPTTFNATGADDAPEWALCEQLDKPKEEAKKDEGKKTGGFANARSFFAATVDEGRKAGDKKEAKRMTLHTNAIQSVGLPGAVEGKTATVISTAGIDGRFLIWNLNKLDCNKAVYGL